MEKKSKVILNFSVSIAIAILAIVFVILYFSALTFPGHTLVKYLLLVVIIAAYGVAIYFYLKHNQTVFRLIMTGLALVAFAFGMLLIYEKTGLKEIIYDTESLRRVMDAAGIWAPLVFVVLQFLQVVVLPIPSTITILAGVACFGAWRCFWYSMLGILLGSLVAFYIGRLVGYRAVAWLIGKETLDGWLEKLKGKDKFFLSAMFLLPAFPDDILCFVAGLSSMSWLYFFVMVLVSRAIAISVSCFSFQLIPFDTWWGLLIWGVLVVGVCVGLYFFSKYSDKIHEKLSQLLHRGFRKK